MAEPPLAGYRILVAEDEYFLARDLCRDLAEAGATMAGPVPTLADAMALIETDPSLDGAVLDVNLGGEEVYPVADALAARAIPFLFLTGYDRASLPARFSVRPSCEKPADRKIVLAEIARVMRGAV